MEFKTIMAIFGMLMAIISGANTAIAQGGYEETLRKQLFLPPYSLSCGACHVGENSGSTATTPIAVTWKTGASIPYSDSDADGFLNVQEASSAMNFNDAATTPFTLAVAGVNDVKLSNVHITGDNAAVETAFADPYTLANLTVASGKQILGGVSVTINAASGLTLLFKAGAAASTSTLYVVDPVAKTNVALASTDWILTSNGGVTINSLPPGQGLPAVIVVERIIPAVTWGYAKQGNASVTGCVTESTTMPLMMVMTMLLLSLFIRRKDD